MAIQLSERGVADALLVTEERRGSWLAAIWRSWRKPRRVDREVGFYDHREAEAFQREVEQRRAEAPMDLGF